MIASYYRSRISLDGSYAGRHIMLYISFDWIDKALATVLWPTASQT